jgi:hypothetical protein
MAAGVGMAPAEENVSSMCASETTQDKPAESGNLDSPGKIVRVERNAAGQIVAHVAGRSEPVVDVRIARCFPWSVPETYISIRNKDGKEIALLKTLGELDETSRAVVEEELRDKVFNPKIRRIKDYRDEFGVTSITAETDRGEVIFQIRSRDDIRQFSATRALFGDADGNVYELVDLNALDPASRKHILHYF